MPNFINETDLEFVDISSEEYRVYNFAAENGYISDVKITKPLRLNVSENGHRIFDAQGISHYVPKGWIHLFWKAKEGLANFVK